MGHGFLRVLLFSHVSVNSTSATYIVSCTHCSYQSKNWRTFQKAMLFHKLGGGHWTQSYFQFVLQGKLFATICSVVEHVLGTGLSGYYLMLLKRIHSCVLLTQMFTVVVICSFALHPPTPPAPLAPRHAWCHGSYTNVCRCKHLFHRHTSGHIWLCRKHEKFVKFQRAKVQHSTHKFWAVCPPQTLR